MTIRLNTDDDMIERMELDLVSKAQAAFTAAGLTANIHGVYSLDDLESKTEEDLCQKLAVGVGYAGCEPTGRVKDPLNTAPGGDASKMIDFLFVVILAVPHGKDCVERYSATKLLTVLRRGVLGSTVSDDATNRTWTFVKESPDISASTESMLYYSQVWRLPLVIVN